MKALDFDVVVLGAGGAGLGAALAARDEGVTVAVVERLDRSGGILNQCIHDGFGLHRYKEALTGPEFASRLALEAKLGADPGLTVLTGRFVRDIDADQRRLVLVGETGVETVTCRALVYAAGARERPFGSLLIPGDRVSGIFTAGVAQRLVNLDNRLPGTRALILGSGDIGLIMARRLTLEGIEVQAVLERLPFAGGLERNVAQCLDDYQIPLLLSTTVAEVHGRGRLEEVVTVQVDENHNPIRGTERAFAVDTLVLSVGLVPSTTPVMDLVDVDPRSRGVVVDAIMGTSRDWVFAAGNCTVIYDLVDYVTDEGMVAGRAAARFAKGEPRPPRLPLVRGRDVGIMNPSSWCPGHDLTLFLRPSRPFEMASWVVRQDDTIVRQTKPGLLTPGEMERLKIATAKLDPSRPVTVEVVPHA
jgi:NADPH-dependent 2,4-dienoyl-CoA reductase/sulfur reductase-like enzyme